MPTFKRGFLLLFLIGFIPLISGELEITDIGSRYYLELNPVSQDSTTTGGMSNATYSNEFYFLYRGVTNFYWNDTHGTAELFYYLDPDNDAVDFLKNIVLSNGNSITISPYTNYDADSISYSYPPGEGTHDFTITASDGGVILDNILDANYADGVSINGNTDVTGDFSAGSVCVDSLCLYNMSDGAGNSSWNESRVNQSLIYNHTRAANLSIVTNYGKWFYNMTPERNMWINDTNNVSLRAGTTKNVTISNGLRVNEERLGRNYLTLYGSGGGTSRRGGAIEWYANNSFLGGFTYVNSNGNLVFDSNAQSSAADTGSGTYINLSSGALKSSYLVSPVVIADTAYTYATVYGLSVQSNTTTSYLEILNNRGTNKGAFFGMEEDSFTLYNYQGGGETTGSYPIVFLGGYGSPTLLSLDRGRSSLNNTNLTIAENFNVRKNTNLSTNLNVYGNTTLTNGNNTLYMPTLKKIDGTTACSNGDALKIEMPTGRIYCG